MAGELEVKITSEKGSAQIKIVKQVTSYKITAIGELISNGSYSLTEGELKKLIENKAKKIYGENVKIEYKER